MVNAVDQSLLLASKQGAKPTSSGNILGKDDFLKILITQLQNQDPANPMDDKEFISQMATFSSLEQLTNMNKNLDKLVNQNANSHFIQHSNLIGNHITFTHDNGQEQEGTIQSVKQDKNGTVNLLLESGQWINPTQLVQISKPENEAN